MGRIGSWGLSPSRLLLRWVGESWGKGRRGDRSGSDGGVGKFKRKCWRSGNKLGKFRKEIREGIV